MVSASSHIDEQEEQANQNKDISAKLTSVVNTSTNFSGRIFCLMGKSACGKDTVYAKVCSKLERDGADIHRIVTYTTRPKRAHEENGDEYFFLTKEKLDQQGEADLIIERRDYDTEYGIWSYATLDDGQISGSNDYLVIVTPEACESFIKRFGFSHVVPMQIIIDDGTRLMRALTREMQQTEPKYDEMCRRYLSDKRDFAELDENPNVTRFTNHDVDQCSGEIVSFIESRLNESAPREDK